jgi:hypothetical protein
MIARVANERAYRQSVDRHAEDYAIRLENIAVIS